MVSFFFSCDGNREKQKEHQAALGGDAEDGCPVRLRPEGELAQHRCRGTGQAPHTSADSTAASLPSLDPSEGRATRPVNRDPGRQERGREPGDTLRTWQPLTLGFPGPAPGKPCDPHLVVMGRPGERKQSPLHVAADPHGRHTHIQGR